MNNTKTIFKSLLIIIVAISLFTVSCSKDEGGTKNPVNPQPIIITGDSITKGISEALKGTVMKFTYTAPTSGNTATATATSLEDLQKLKTLKITIDGADVKVKDTTTKFPVGIDVTDNITITITITPASGNSFDKAKLSPYTKKSNTEEVVEVKLTLSPADTKKWNEDPDAA